MSMAAPSLTKHSSAGHRFQQVLAYSVWGATPRQSYNPPGGLCEILPNSPFCLPLPILIGFYGSLEAAFPGARYVSAQFTKGAIQHIIYVQFDNTHFRRDNPNVPRISADASLAQLHYGNGVLMRTTTPCDLAYRDGYLTSAHGVYRTEWGSPCRKLPLLSDRWHDPNRPSRRLWTAPLFAPGRQHTDTTPEMINENGKVARRHGCHSRRAGCDFGAGCDREHILENTVIDIRTVFGAGPPRPAEVVANPGQAFADFVGIACIARRTQLSARPRTTPPTSALTSPEAVTVASWSLRGKYVNPTSSSSGR